MGYRVSGLALQRHRAQHYPQPYIPRPKKAQISSGWPLIKRFGGGECMAGGSIRLYDNSGAWEMPKLLQRLSASHDGGRPKFWGLFLTVPESLLKHNKFDHIYIYMLLRTSFQGQLSVYDLNMLHSSKLTLK